MRDGNARSDNYSNTPDNTNSSSTRLPLPPNLPDMSGKSGLLWAAVAGVGAVVALRGIARQNRRITLRGKVAFITGGSRGLGLILARRLATAGARVAICARDAEELERARQDILHGAVGSDIGPGDVLALTGDVSDRARVEEMIRITETQLGPIDILINNAGVIQVGPMEAMTEADYEEAMRIHFWGPLYTTEAVLPSMRARRAGRIVNISSIGGKVGVPHLMPYCASKFALTGYSQTLRAELMRHGIYVTTVCPGLMRTGSPTNAFFKSQHQKEYAWFILGDSLPFISTKAEKAADDIVNALVHGDAELVTTIPAQVATAVNGVFPGLVADMMGLVNQMLPEPGGIGMERRKGSESETPLTQSPLTALTQKAAERNNETG